MPIETAGWPSYDLLVDEKGRRASQRRRRWWERTQREMGILAKSRGRERLEVVSRDWLGVGRTGNVEGCGTGRPYRSVSILFEGDLKGGF